MGDQHQQAGQDAFQLFLFYQLTLGPKRGMMIFASGWPGDRGPALQGRGKSALHRARCRVTPGSGD